MTQRMVCLNSIDKVKVFINIITRFAFDIDLGSDKYIVDAKSLMGILTLDLSKPVSCTIHAVEADCMELLKSIAQFIVEENAM